MWLICFAVLIAAVGVYRWPIAPRIDLRLVGQWHGEYSPYYFTLSGDGEFTGLVGLVGRWGSPQRRTWHVDGSVLTLRTRYFQTWPYWTERTNIERRWRRRWDEFFSFLDSNKPPDDIQRFRIANATNGELILEHLPAGGQFDYGNLERH